MPIRKAIHSLVVVRKDKRLEVAPGQEFDFTEDEIDQINQANPDALSTEGTVDLAAQDAKPAKASKTSKTDADL